MKIGHVSDVHLNISATILGKQKWDNGINTVYENRRALFQFIIEEFIQAKVDYIVISGDLFDRARPYPQEYCDLVKILLSIPKAINILIINGNHDEVTQKGCIIDMLSGIANNIYVETTCKISHGLPFVMAPWSSSIDQIKVCRDNFKDATPILIYHAGVWSKDAHWVELDGETGNVSLEQLESLDCKAILLGHHHGQVQLNHNTWYAGSPEVFTFGEENDNKGFLIWDIDKEVTTYNYSTKELRPIWKTFKPIEFLENGDEFDGYVRIKGEVDEKERLQIIKKCNSFKCLDYKLDLESKVKHNKVFKLQGTNDQDILKNYLISKDIKNWKELLKLDKELKI